MKIFIVDDEEISCRGIRSMVDRGFGKNKNEVYTYTDAPEALTSAEILRPEVIILDIVMPEINGIQFIEKIEEIYSPKIVVISGNDDYDYVRKSFKFKVSDYLLKPVEFSEIKSVLEEIAVSEADLDGEPIKPSDENGFSANIFTDDTDTAEANIREKKIVEAVREYIRCNYQNDLSLAYVSNIFNINYSYLSRIFKAYCGITFSQYLFKIRMEKAMQILEKNPQIKILDVAKQVGYTDYNIQNFTRAFKNYFGKSPKYYKNANCNSKLKQN